MEAGSAVLNRNIWWKRLGGGPGLFLAVWLLFLAAILWKKAGLSHQPPIYDSLTYLQKGLEFWRHIQAGQWVNPFNLTPVVRPPGVILMAMPFGMEEGTRGFFFRSAFLPIFCSAMGAFLAVGPQQTERGRWGRAFLAVLVSTMPVFYHFEIAEGMPSPAWWGMADNFQGGVAALAMGGVLYSIRQCSVCWLFFAGSMAALTLLIKPSGGVLMIFVGAVWLVLVRMAAGNAGLYDAETWRRYWWRGVAVFALVYGGTALLCITSRYLSKETFDFANQVLATTRQVLFLDVMKLPELLRHSLGYHLMFGGVTACMFGILGVYKEKDCCQGRTMAVSAAAIWSGGVWYWLVGQAGGNHIRYFIPFFLCGLLLLLPQAQLLWCRSRTWRNGMIVLTLLPVVVYSVLLLQANPGRQVENWVGVHVSMGDTDKEVAAGEALVTEARKEGRNLSVYAFAAGEPADLATGVPSIVFENVGTYAFIRDPGKPTFLTRLQVDWQRGFVTRLDELLASDYILFQPLEDKGDEKALPGKNVESFFQENRLFRQKLTKWPQQEGIIEVAATERVRLIKIEEPRKAEKAWRDWLNAYNWHKLFYETNEKYMVK